MLAYTDGASIMQEIANRLGGTDRMADFLRYLVQSRTFVPFTTLDLAGDLEAFSGIDLRARFLGWLYNGQEPAAAYAATAEPGGFRKVLELDPPWIRRKGR
jgi:aminopeptidase N